MAGRVRAGEVPGGLDYGYRVTATGEREIIEEQAAVIRRVFDETLKGRTPREIAAGLNRDGIPAPRGGAWNAATINGSRKRSNDVLRNELYAGRLVWNRQQFVKDPDTGKRVTRVNAKATHMAADLPHLCIVDHDIWSAAQAILERKGGPHATPMRRSPHLFSGLLRCGVCGGSFVSAGSVRDGK
jgi:site-specific DNA recombinase